jgi:GMP synthase PP-ATPase subunit
MVSAFHWVVSRDGNETRAITHHNVLALTQDFETSLLERLNCPEMINTGNLRHR